MEKVKGIFGKETDKGCQHKSKDSTPIQLF